MKISSFLPLILLIAGVMITIYSLWNIIDSKRQAATTLTEAKELVENRSPIDKDLPLKTVAPQIGDTVGLLKLPAIQSELAIIEGTDPDDLVKGVGHFAGSFYPGQSGQIVLSGHRDTVFTRLGELKLGEDINIQMPYGDFTYEIIETKIVKADDLSIITLQNKQEELILTTCYPFGFIGNAPERYIIYAKLKN
ncbi:class D sortase [Bacillus sp. DJP31]|uniref:class D sortase n=1 Tax=Bacillus sp. DJP31 TaxID=3409789 RepID=UPI003BB78DCC